MSRAEEAALKAYPKQDKYSEYLDGSNALKRDVFIQGYEQAEKDLALTWQDIIYLEDLMAKVHYEFRNGIGQESFGKEVLERFIEHKYSD